MLMRRVEEFRTKEAWLEGRKRGIGSSDAPIIMGVSRRKSPLMLFAEKTGKAPPEEETEQMEWGLIMQPHILARYGRETGREIMPQDLKIWWDQALDFLGASPDAIARNEDKQHLVVEAKNASAYTRAEWMIEPPVSAQVQLQHQIMVCGVYFGVIAVLIGGNEFYRTPDIPRHDKLIEAMRDKEIEFKRRVELNDPMTEMDAHETTKTALKLLWPQDSGETIALTAEALHWHHERQEAQAMLDKYETQKDLADNYLKRMIGDATFGVLPGGKIRYSYKTKKGYHRKAGDVQPTRVLREVT